MIKICIPYHSTRELRNRIKMGASRISHCFKQLKQRNLKALIPYVTAGDPEKELTVQLLHSLVETGADLIELGVPFSDPIADGPVIQRASERALAQGVNLEQCLDIVKEFRVDNQNTPVVLMGYMNPIENYGWTKFARKADNVGVDGVLLVDCPPEESSRFLGELRRYGIDCIFLVAPTTPKQRLEKILAEASGYIYYVSLRGVTGANNINSKDVSSKLNTIKEFTNLPVVVGFGISSKKSVSEIAKTSADGIVVGSALIKVMEQAKEKDLCPIDTVKNQMSILRSGLL